MQASGKTILVIAFVATAALFVLFSGGMATGAMMSGGFMGGGMMGGGVMGGISWMWIPTVLTLALGVLLGWAIWAKK